MGGSQRFEATASGVAGPPISNGCSNSAATSDERAEGEKRAAAWTAALAVANTAPAATPAAASPPPPPSLPVKPGGCPGWPFPTLPCTEQFPALTGTPSPTGAPQLAAVARLPRAPETKPPLAALNDALVAIDCASLRSHIAGDGAAVVTGTVPDVGAKSRLEQVVARYFPSSRNEIDIDIVPPPVCRALVALERLRPSGATGKRNLSLRLDNGTTRLRQGDPIALDVRGPDYPTSLRIDYFALDGQVLHLKPEKGEAPPSLAAGSARRFGNSANGDDWQAGGEPFGIELIAVVATPVPLQLGNRPRIEEAASYLRDLKQAVERDDRNAAHPALAATLLVETSGR